MVNSVSRLMPQRVYLHHKVEFKQKIEVPAFPNHGITQNILQLDSVNILMWRQIPDLGELERRREIFNLAPSDCNFVPSP